MDIFAEIKKQIAENSILLYMKGSPQFPQCGFSARAVKCIKECDVDFAFINILEAPEIRQALPQYSDWPTFPQLYVNEELIGGSDIISELHEQGELASLLNSALNEKGTISKGE